MKTFYQILAETDDEHTYRIHSTADIHNPALFEKIKISLLSYEIKSIECESYKPLSKSNTLFPDEPNSPTYTIKVVTRYPLTKGFLSILAMEAHIHISHLKVDPDKVIDPVNEPEEISTEESQKQVGTKRIAAFIKELQQDHKERQEMTWTREVYESFYTTHRGLQAVIGKPVRNGYYMVEAYCDDGKNYLKAEGPFQARPDGAAYYDRIRVGTSQIVSENLVNDVYGVELLVEAPVTFDSAPRANPVYKLIDGMTGGIVCIYKAKTIALRDCATKNAEHGDRRYYVLKPNGGKVTA